MKYVLTCYGYKPHVFEAETRAEAAAKAAEIAESQDAKAYSCWSRLIEVSKESEQADNKCKIERLRVFYEGRNQWNMC